MTRQKARYFRAIVLLLVVISCIVDYYLLPAHWALVSNTMLSVSILFIAKRIRDYILSSIGLTGLLFSAAILILHIPDTYVANPTVHIDNWRLLLNTGCLSFIIFLLALIAILAFGWLDYIPARGKDIFKPYRTFLIPFVVLVFSVLLVLLETSNFWYYKGQTGEIFLKFEVFEKHLEWLRKVWLQINSTLLFILFFWFLARSKMATSKVLRSIVALSLLISLLLFLWPGMAMLDKMRYSFMNTEVTPMLLIIRYVCWMVMFLAGLSFYLNRSVVASTETAISAFFVLYGLVIGLSELTTLMVIINFDSVGLYIVPSRHLPWTLFALAYTGFFSWIFVKHNKRILFFVIFIIWIIALIKMIAIDLQSVHLTGTWKLLLPLLFFFSAVFIAFQIFRKSTNLSKPVS